jgi:MinD-like ATPase involved in chromosome partitioning or flagellar assembly
VTTEPEVRPCVLVLAGGAGWEAPVLRALVDAGIVVARRCVDVPDLMAAASASGADVAVVAGDLPLLDAEVVLHLLRHDVRTLAVTTDHVAADRLARLGVLDVTPSGATDVVAAVLRAASRDLLADVGPAPGTAGDAARPLDDGGRSGRGRVVAVWGPAGAPGRTTIAVSLAGELAAAGHAVVLVDADPYGGAVAQHLGILDETSGLLSVARMANLGTLDEPALARSCRRVGERLGVLTGLPRADRRVEVRPGVIGAVLEIAAALGDVVVDCGFCLEDAEVPTSRDRATLDALAAADEIVVVGAAEPTGLSRLARALVELRDVAPAAPVRVVVNRMRPTLGWRERDIVGMVEGYARTRGVHFLPEDRTTLDRALVTGRSLAELGESRLRSAVGELVTAIHPTIDPTLRTSARGRRRSGASRRAATR